MIKNVNKSVNLLERSLDYLWVKNEAISNNIANVNTPGYKRYDVSFGDYLSTESNKFNTGSVKKNDKFLPIGKDRRIIVAPQINRKGNISMRRDGNSVDIDVENAELAKNSMEYNVTVNQITKRLSIIKQAINEGRK